MQVCIHYTFSKKFALAQAQRLIMCLCVQTYYDMETLADHSITVKKDKTTIVRLKRLYVCRVYVGFFETTQNHIVKVNVLWCML